MLSNKNDYDNFEHLKLSIEKPRGQLLCYIQYVHDTSVGTTNVDPVVTGIGIIGRGVPKAISGGSITHIMIHG